jgi:hypothetical protein
LLSGSTKATLLIVRSQFVRYTVSRQPHQLLLSAASAAMKAAAVLVNVHATRAEDSLLVRTKKVDAEHRPFKITTKY